MSDERRNHPRALVNVHVTYTILNSLDATPYEYGETVTENISEGGLCMLIRDTLEENRLLYINIEIPSRNQSLLMLGKTVSVHENVEDGAHRVRIKFVGMLPRGMKEMIESLQAEQESRQAE